MKVGDGRDKVEIDVCGRCLSVWCDRGEYETLAPPPPPKPGETTMRELLERTSPSARERYVATMFESLPEEIALSDFDVGDLLRDVVRIVVGAPTLWRRVRPVSPIFTVALALALPIAQACAYYSCNALSSGGGASPALFHVRDFWVLGEDMAVRFGFDLSSPLNALTFMWLQPSGRMALFFAPLVFMPLAVIERRIGHVRFLGLFFAMAAAAVAAHALFEAAGLAAGSLCGIVPVALGMLAYLAFAWPDLRMRGQIGLMGVYVGIVGAALFGFGLLGWMANDFISIGLGPAAACLALGGALGVRTNRRHRRQTVGSGG